MNKESEKKLIKFYNMLLPITTEHTKHCPFVKGCDECPFHNPHPVEGNPYHYKTCMWWSIMKKSFKR